jgi:DNA-binding transcriptional LysR family regulator
MGGRIGRSSRADGEEVDHAVEALRTFIAVANTLNFTRAGEKLHLSQSSVTEQLQSLESDLGTSLFDRSRRKLTPTPAGCRPLDRHHCT